MAEFEDFDSEVLEAESEEGIVRVKLPGHGELIGVVEKLLGNARMFVRCIDGKQRNAQVPGGKRRRLYIREGDLVIIKPWEFEEDTKAYVVYKYSKTQVYWLRKKGYLAKLEEEF
ncbi:MAG: translation initiation factor eIF-1A [Candidatus Nanoarchaeia archaeon]|jgi:translation initiation factor 1A